MILVDTSAWVAYLRGDENARRLQPVLHDTSVMACSEPIFMEVLGGARSSADYMRLRRMLFSGRWIQADVSSDFEAAARLYGSCRSIGITPRGFLDCMIASIAIRTDVPLLTLDREFRHFQRVAGLRLHALSA